MEKGRLTSWESRAEAYSDMVELHSTVLLHMASRLEGNRLAGEELLQGALVRTWDRFDPAWDDRTFIAYVRTAMINAQRSRWRRPLREIPAAELTLAPVGDRAETRVDDADRLVRALRQLPLHQRKAVVLRYYDDLSEAQAAALLGCNVGTIKSQTSRALARLRPLLRDPAPAEAKAS